MKNECQWCWGLLKQTEDRYRSMGNICDTCSSDISQVLFKPSKSKFRKNERISSEQCSRLIIKRLQINKLITC